MNSFMPRIPRVLFIDDDFKNDSVIIRFCRSLDLEPVIDMSAPPRLFEEKDWKVEAGKEWIMPVEAAFISGQREDRCSVHNDLSSVLDCVQIGWPGEHDWRWSLIILDVRFDESTEGHESSPDTTEEFGFSILKAIHEKYGDRVDDVPQIVLSSGEVGEVPTAVLPFIQDFLPKYRLNAKGGIQSLRETILFNGYVEDFGASPRYLQLNDGGRSRLLGRSLAHLQMLRKARVYSQHLQVCRGQALILGSTGTGKTQLARFMHETMFMAENKGNTSPKAIPFVEHLGQAIDVEHSRAELFGQWVGAYTGADESSPGAAELAHKGVLFIDEIANILPATQTSLLRFLGSAPKERLVNRMGLIPSGWSEDKRIQKQFCTQHRVMVPSMLDALSGSIRVDVVALLATNAELNKSSWRRENSYRDDLYYRYRGDLPPLSIPSLKQRDSDILLLFEWAFRSARAKIESSNGKNHKHESDGEDQLVILDETKDILLNHAWAGNIRELTGVATHAAIRAKESRYVVPQFLLLNDDH